MINILIPEDIPGANKGEAALFFGIAKSLSIFPEHRISLFSLHPDKDSRAYGEHANIVGVHGLVPNHLLDGMGSFYYKLFQYLKFIGACFAFGILYKIVRQKSLGLMRHAAWRHCSEADLVLMCHDSFYAPLYHGTLLLLFSSLHKPVMLYGGTILAPTSVCWFERWLRNAFNRFVLNKADWITLRENHSFAYLSSLTLKRVEVFPDLAFIADTAPDAETDQILQSEGIPLNVPLCGFAFSQKELDHAFPELPLPERKERALAELVPMMNHIVGTLGMQAVFIPHSIGPTPRVDDRIAANWVRERCKEKYKIHIIRNDYNQLQLKGIAKRLDITVGTRLHFTIDALCNHVPSLLITHKNEYRCHGIIGDMLGQSRYLYNIEAVSALELIQIITELWEQRNLVKADLSNRLPSIIKQTMMHGQRAKEVFTCKHGYQH